MERFDKSKNQIAFCIFRQRSHDKRQTNASTNIGSAIRRITQAFIQSFTHVHSLPAHSRASGSCTLPITDLDGLGSGLEHTHLSLMLPNFHDAWMLDVLVGEY